MLEKFELWNLASTLKNLARTFLVAGSALSVVATSTVSWAQTEDYYLVDGDRVDLIPSSNYQAYRAQLPSDFSPQSVTERLGGGVNAGVSVVLARYGIVIVPTGGPISTQSVRVALDNIGDIESEPPVYEVSGVDHVLVNEFAVRFDADVSADQAVSVIAGYGARVVDRSNAAKGRYLITFEDLDERAALARSNQLNQDASVRYSEPNLVRVYPARPGALQPHGLVDNSGCAPSDVIDDDRFSCQWGLDNRGDPLGIADADINAIDAWNLPKSGADPVVVAVIDEGVDTRHEDLRDIILAPYDAVDNDDDQEPLPGDGHGTACAGIIGAVVNGIGVAGVSPNVRIMPIRIATGNAFGGWDTSNFIIARGLETAVDRGAQILSNSWGGGAPSNLINDAIDDGIERGRVFVFAAGNDAGPVTYPARLSANRPIIAVSATNEWDEFKTKFSRDEEKWWGSNFGPEVVVAAPGVHIETTDISGADGYDIGDYVPAFNGTSSAAPFVAGVVTLVVERNPELSPQEVRDIIAATSDDLGQPGFDIYFGHGRVNAGKAVQAVTK